MKRIFLLSFIAVLFIACNQNVPVVEDHQPKNPATWSPVGHKYVSVDSTYKGRYYGAQIYFFSKDSFFHDLFYERNVSYHIEYPEIYVSRYRLPEYIFIDTLTISKARDLLDESNCYKLVY